MSDEVHYLDNTPQFRVIGRMARPHPCGIVASFLQSGFGYFSKTAVPEEVTCPECITYMAVQVDSQLKRLP